MKLLVAVEDKLFGDAITNFVVNQDWSSDLHIKVVHVLEPLHIPAFHGYPSELIASINEERARSAKSLVLAVGTAIQSKIPTARIEEVIEEGVPKSVILKLAEDWPADVLLLGSHGRTGLGRFLLGSVSLSVLSEAPCSVIVVKIPGGRPSSSGDARQNAQLEKVG